MVGKRDLRFLQTFCLLFYECLCFPYPQPQMYLFGCFGFSLAHGLHSRSDV